MPWIGKKYLLVFQAAQRGRSFLPLRCSSREGIKTHEGHEVYEAKDALLPESFATGPEECAASERLQGAIGSSRNSREPFMTLPSWVAATTHTSSHEHFTPPGCGVPILC